VKLSLLLPVSAIEELERGAIDEGEKESDTLLHGSNHAVIGFKLFSDGSLGARTAALLDPYSDDPGNRGILYLGREKIAEIAARVKKLGLVLATHAIGDRAIQEVVEGYRLARVKKSDGFRIEHCSVMNQRQIRSLGEVTVSIQPSFATSDYWIKERLGRNRKKRVAYPLKSLLRVKGHYLIGGSDAPVESLNPLRGVLSATRNPLSGESLSLREGLSIYTSSASDKSPLTRLGGVISRRRDCDLVILDCVEERHLCSSKVSALFLGGKLVWPNTGGIPSPC
jgi:predicted amidohydrolase YtcJ